MSRAVREPSVFPFPPGGHLQTILPAILRRVSVVTRTRERIATPDGDFLDLDWAERTGCGRLVILTHGLEGSSSNACVQGMAAAFRRAGWDALAWNLRGCSGEPNRLLRSYHSGSTDDLGAVIAHAAQTYDRIALVGFSLGGNITLKYLGDAGEAVDARIVGAAAFSVPCDLASSARHLESPANRIYMRHFLCGLRKKIRDKARMFPGWVSEEGLCQMRTFREFDGAYTAPMNGFLSAEDYWERASSRPVLGRIRVPALLVNARNDPFLPPECYPEDAAGSGHFQMEAPRHGGHIGFFALARHGEFWSESRAVAFIGRMAERS